MCGIVGVVRRRAQRAVPDPGALRAALAGASTALATDGELLDRLGAAAAALEALDTELRGVPGVLVLLRDLTLATDLEAGVGELERDLDELEQHLDDPSGAPVDVATLEKVNAALVRARDAAWAVRRDRVRTARAVADLAGTDVTPAAIEAFLSVQIALSAIDRLEVRGRDSAGLHLLVRDHGLDLDDPDVRATLAVRTRDPLFRSGSVRVAGAGTLSFVYKAAAEIGELGDNTRVLRD